MAENPFYRLAPFIQEYIYRAKWDSLRSIQVQATQAVLDTNHHILIMSGTASGKTEAAFLPILTDLYSNPSSSIGAIYIGPLKALINDQFQRLTGLLEEVDIPVQSWHGDISQAKKEKFIKNAKGILQITPESLEAMLIKRQNDLGRLFGDLRFVVIDEVHAFIGSDRGRQIICQLQRLGRLGTEQARRIGLSATIGNPAQAMDWLKGGTNNAVSLIDDRLGQRSVEIGLDHFPMNADPEGRNNNTESPEQALLSQKIFNNIYEMTHLTRKTLIFVNSRQDAEFVTSQLRASAQKHHTNEYMYHIHHGNISAPLREAAETAMRDQENAACTIATVTLELGIDLGQLDQVLQLDATHSVSSFVQRLGRSGRRGNPSRIFFYCRDPDPDSNKPLGRQIPWNLLQTIAIIQLYLEERWIEPPTIPQLPLSLLYHQTMSCLTSSVELSPPKLAENVLSLAPFEKVSQEHYRTLLRFLLETRHLERTEINGLIIGLAAEKIVNDYHFYATFEEEILYQVRDSSREIGTIPTPPEVGQKIGLAGYSWNVLDVDQEKRIIFVERVAAAALPRWSGGGTDIHFRILQRIRKILAEDATYGYLQEGATKLLASARQIARKSGLIDQSILPIGGNRYMLLPWQGSRVFETLEMALVYCGLKIDNAFSPFYLEINYAKGDVPDIRTLFRTILNEMPTAADLIKDIPFEDIQRAKFDKYIPEALLREAFAVDRLDIDGCKAALNALIAN